MVYAIFLRGINTGGMKLKMDDFKNILQEASCKEITTIQNAGTAVFSFGSGDLANLKSAIETMLARHIGKPVSSMIRNMGEIKAIADRMRNSLSPADFHDYIFLTRDPSVFPEIEKMHAAVPFASGERLEPGDGYFIWTIAKGSTLNEFGKKVLGSKKYQDKLTSRNYNTIQKVFLAMGTIAP